MIINLNNIQVNKQNKLDEDPFMTMCEILLTEGIIILI